MPPENSYNPAAKYSFSYNNYIPITNPVSPYKSWIPPSHSCYIPEAIKHYIYLIDYSAYQTKFFKKLKKALEIE